MSNASCKAVFMKLIEASVLPVIKKLSKLINIMIKSPSYLFIYKFLSDLHLAKFCDSKKESIFAYQALGTRFNPYNDFRSLQTNVGYDMYPSGCFM